MAARFFHHNADSLPLPAAMSVGYGVAVKRLAIKRDIPRCRNNEIDRVEVSFLVRPPVTNVA
jgi:hypothetical protein